MRILIKGGRIIDPATGHDYTGDVFIKGGKIHSSGPGIASQIGLNVDKIIDASNKWVIPGLVDMHVHLREPGEEYKETIESGSQAAVAGGFTALACMPNTMPVNDSAAITEFIIEKAKECGLCEVYPVGAVSKGLKGESLADMGELFEAGAVAVTDDGFPVRTSQMMRRALEYAKIFGKPVISHSEDLSLSRGGVMHEGRTSTRLGLRGIPRAAEEIAIYRDISLCELTGGKLHIAHVSSAGSVELIRRAKGKGIHVTSETAPHYFTLTDESVSTYDTHFKMNPPLRENEDVEAIKQGLSDGTIDVIATDHAPHSSIEKDLEFESAANGIIGLESALPLVLKLVCDGILNPLACIEKLTVNPARILGLPEGQIRSGLTADITVLDPEYEYVIDANQFYSKARNCPFHGWKVRGKAMVTIKDGRIVYENGLILDGSELDN